MVVARPPVLQCVHGANTQPCGISKLHMTRLIALKRILLLVVTAGVLSGCAAQTLTVPTPQGVSTQDWAAPAVEGHGDFWRLMKRPLTIGDYSTDQLDYSLWATAPTRSRTTLGDPDQGLSGGTETVRNDSAYRFVLNQGGAPLARIQCRQVLDISGVFIAHAEDATERFEVSANDHYVGELVCESTAIAPHWQPWRLHVAARDGRPYFGVLRLAERSYSVIGTQASQSFELGETTGFYLRFGEQTRALVQRINGGALRLHPGLDLPEQRALVAAAMALLLANDPVTAE